MMKRMLLCALVVFLTGSLCAAQAQLRNFTQTGPATAEVNSDKATASHPTLPIGTQVRVTNLSNNKQAIVTITGRISPSANRIADLSTGAAKELDINLSDPTTPVKIESINPEPAPRPAAPQPPPEPPKKEEPPPEEPKKEEPPPEEPKKEEPPPEPPKKEEPPPEEPKKEEPKTAEAPPPQAQSSSQQPLNIYNIIMSPGALAQDSTVSATTPGQSGSGSGGGSGGGQYQPIIIPPQSPQAPVVVPITQAPATAASPATSVSPATSTASSPATSTSTSPVTSMAPSLATQTPQSQQAQTPVQPYIPPSPQATQGAPAVRVVEPAASSPQQQQPIYVPVPVPQPPAPQPQQQQPPTVQPPPQQQQTYPAARVMPSMPTAGSGNYRVQVGSYTGTAAAKEMYDKLVRGGFSPQYERYENYTRVVLQSVNSSGLPEVARRLGALGITEIWVRKEP
jgi:cell division protein FtsN